jgi:hypothetical protein
MGQSIIRWNNQLQFFVRFVIIIQITIPLDAPFILITRIQHEYLALIVIIKLDFSVDHLIMSDSSIWLWKSGLNIGHLIVLDFVGPKDQNYPYCHFIEYFILMNISFCNLCCQLFCSDSSMWYHACSTLANTWITLVKSACCLKKPDDCS